MKTLRRFIQLCTITITFLAIQSAFAFYNPQVGRWANRDPIHEFGFLALKGGKLGFHIGSELNLYTFVGNNPNSYIDVAGLKKRLGGLTGGACCNTSDKDQWWLDGDTHKWTKLPPGKCTGAWDDCDGMTCGGGFYYVQDLESSECSPNGERNHVCGKYGPGPNPYPSRRWTPPVTARTHKRRSIEEHLTTILHRATAGA